MPRQCLETPWGLLYFSWAFMAVTMAFHGDAMGCHDISWHCRGTAIAPLDTAMEAHDISCAFMDFRELAQAFMVCHGTALRLRGTAIGFDGTDCRGNAMKAFMALP